MTLIVGFAPGGAIDGIARTLAPSLRASLGETVIVENRTGAGGRIAVHAVISAPPTGHTLLLTPGATITLHPYLYGELQYDPLTQLIPISLIGTSDLAVVVAADSPVRNIDELMRWYNENPKLSSCGTSGAGSVSHFVMIEIARKANSAVVFVHYRSALQQIEALMEGSLKTAVVVPWIALPRVESGELRALATTGVARSLLLRDVPTLRESGIDVVVREWAGLFAPVGTPRAIVNQLATATAEALATPAVKAAFRKFGLDPGEAGPVEFAAMVKADYDRWGPVVKRSGVKAES